jgi:hypothetical protein
MPTIDHPNCISIDRGPDDTNYLPNARAHWPNHYDHSNVAECGANLLNCCKNLPNGGNLLIVGHGNVGILSVGGGKELGNFDQILSSGNWQRNINNPAPPYPYYWKNDFVDLYGLVNYLIVWGCYVGAEASGAALLYQLSHTIGASVSAYTGLVYGNGKPEPGGEWQISNLNDRTPPDPKHKVSNPAPTRRGLLTLMNLYNKPEHKSIPVEDIKSCELSLYGRASQIFYGKEAQEFLNTINLEEPVINTHGIGAIITGHLILNLSLDGKEQSRKFTILADSILKDEASPATYYRFNSLFNEVIGVREFTELLPQSTGDNEEWFNPFSDSVVSIFDLNKTSRAFLDINGNQAQPTFTSSKNRIIVRHGGQGNYTGVGTSLLQNGSIAYRFNAEGTYTIANGTYTHVVFGQMAGGGAPTSIASTIQYG